MWDYVFSPRHMMFDAAAGVVFFLLFRVLRGGGRQPSMLERAAFLLVALSVSRWYLGGPPARAMPTGYVGQMVQACTQENSREDCLCAVDAVEAHIGHPALVQLAVRAGVNAALPRELLEALAQCRG
jgi:hypothetical protein